MTESVGSPTRALMSNHCTEDHPAGITCVNPLLLTKKLFKFIPNCQNTPEFLAI